jgi:mannose-1-phosphate guanylyltransferase
VAANEDALLTLGIEPTRPDTGYGYIQYEGENKDGVFKVRRFVEKPDYDTARRLLISGDHLWNAGIFVWKAERLLEAFRAYSPEIYDTFNNHRGQLNTPEEEAFLQTHYPNTPNISVDYAIMEKAKNVYTLPADIGWSDLGTWASLHAHLDKDPLGNVVLADHHLLDNTNGCLIRTSVTGKLIVIKDLQNYMVIDEPDVLMLVPIDKEQEIKGITGEVKKRFGDQFS